MLTVSSGWIDIVRDYKHKRNVYHERTFTV